MDVLNLWNNIVSEVLFFTKLNKAFYRKTHVIQLSFIFIFIFTFMPDHLSYFAEE